MVHRLFLINEIKAIIVCTNTLYRLMIDIHCGLCKAIGDKVVVHAGMKNELC